MQVTPLKTQPIHAHDDLYEHLQQALPQQLSEKTVVVVTSKIVSLCEGSVVAKDSIDKQALIEQEAEYFLPASSSLYNVSLTVKDNILAVNAGVDESNSAEGYVLLPKNSTQSAQQLWEWLKQTYSLDQVGVIITDSTSLPLKWGTIGRALSYCGIKPLKNLIGQPDVFGRKLVMTKMNIVEGLAAAAVLEMGEGGEQTPLCLITECSHAEFADQPPSEQELADLKIELADDVYAPLLTAVEWQKKV
jgi:putative folate metabolism gamma-glutamate ligase